MTFPSRQQKQTSKLDQDILSIAKSINNLAERIRILEVLQAGGGISTVYYQIMEDEDVPEVQRYRLNFIGEGINLTDGGAVNDQTDVRHVTRCLWHPEPTSVEGANNFYCFPEDPLDDFEEYNPGFNLNAGDDGCDGLKWEIDDTSPNDSLVGYGKSIQPPTFEPGAVYLRAGWQGVPLTNRSDVGLALWEDITDEFAAIYTIGFRMNGTICQIEVNLWDDFQTLNAGSPLATHPAGGSTGGWFGVRSDFAGNYYFMYSNCGQHWVDLYVDTINFTPVEAGYFGNNRSGRDPQYQIWEWYQQDDAGEQHSNANIGFPKELHASACPV